MGGSSKSSASLVCETLGQNVNLGNISGSEVISLETIRVGLRGDTFNQFI